MTAARRRRQNGLFRGCCLGIVLLLAIIGLAAFVVDRALAAPDLGPAPAGPDDGATEAAIALSLAPAAAAQLVTTGHTLMTLSEHDLTVIAAAHNPHPDRFHDLQARVRNGLIAVSAATSFGPLTPIVVGYLSVTLNRATSPPQVVVQLKAVDVGALHIPSWLQSFIVSSLAPAITLNQLFGNLSQVRPVLNAVQANLDCVAVAPTGLLVGVHRPDVNPDQALCAPGGA